MGFFEDDQDRARATDSRRLTPHRHFEQELRDNTDGDIGDVCGHTGEVENRNWL